MDKSTVFAKLGTPLIVAVTSPVRLLRAPPSRLQRSHRERASNCETPRVIYTDPFRSREGARARTRHCTPQSGSRRTTASSGKDTPLHRPAEAFRRAVAAHRLGAGRARARDAIALRHHAPGQEPAGFPSSTAGAWGSPATSSSFLAVPSVGQFSVGVRRSCLNACCSPEVAISAVVETSDFAELDL